MTTTQTTGRSGHLIFLLFGAAITLLGLTLAIGGAWLIALGGSWYYVLAGIGLLIAGIQLARGRVSGAWWFAAVFLGTFFWTLWEAGPNYWGWIPRFGLLVVLAFVLALLLPRLDGGPSKRTSGLLAVVLAVVFLCFFAWAFVPHDFTATEAKAAQSATSRSTAPPQSLPAGSVVQAANAPEDGDWPAYGRGNATLRYSPLTQIAPENVATLERAWVYRTGDLPPDWGAETTPIEVDGTLYLCSATNHLIALDAATGDELWRYEHAVAEEYIPYTAACRGVAYFEVPATLPDGETGNETETGIDSANAAATSVKVDAAAQNEDDSAESRDNSANAGDENEPAVDSAVASAPTCSPRIIEGTLDHLLIAVDARTGKPCRDFGNGGKVDIARGMGNVDPGMVSITSAPTIVRGVIVTGHQVLDGISLNAPSGVIQGYDAITGELLWAWDMARPAVHGRPSEGETYTRGTPNMWTTASADEQLGLVYLPLGNSAVDFWSSSRHPLENEYATSLVAIDVTTGEPEWHFQTVHKDVWDYDLGSTGTLVDFPTENGPVPAIVLASKQGDIYVLNRRTGEPLVAVEERPVPQGGVEPDERSETQPFSLYNTLRQPDLTESDMWGLTPIDQMICRIEFQAAAYEGVYTAPTAGTPYIEYPGYNGGSDWGGIAVDPGRGVIVANYNDIAMYNELIPRAEVPNPAELHPGSQPQFGAPFAISIRAGWRMPVTGLPCKAPPYGGIRAIDLASGETLWDRPFGTARTNGPFGIASHLPIVIGTPNNGGPAVTAGGLIFIAAATDNLIHAIDIDTGETLWTDVLPAGGQASPMVYAVDGRQFVVIMAGGHHFMETPRGDYVIAYALPE